jgi:hypothetical protein
MRWTPDGRGLAFAFHADAAPGKYGYGYNPVASIRVLDTSAPGERPDGRQPRAGSR